MYFLKVLLLSHPVNKSANIWTLFKGGHLFGALLEASPGLDLLENDQVYPGYIPGKLVCIALAPGAFHWKGTDRVIL